MAIRRITLFLIAVSLGACATTKDVVSIGNGSYEIAGSSVTAFSSGGSEKLRLLRVANQYCGTLGKQALLEGAEATNGHLGSGAIANGTGFSAAAFHPGQRATADVVFQCQ